jgi:hypothetical protein
VTLWFGGDAGGIGQLVARKKYSKAIVLLRQELERNAADPRLRMQLADVLVLGGHGAEAVPVLIDLADDYANDGAGAKAIAVLKKIKKLAPGRGDVDQRLTKLIRRKDRGRGASTTGRMRAVKPGPGGFSGPVYSGSVSHAPVVTDSQRIAAARAATWSPTTRPEDVPDEPIGAANPPRPASLQTEAPSQSRPEFPAEEVIEWTPEDEAEVIEVSEEEFRGQVFQTISQVLAAPLEPVIDAEPEIEIEADAGDVSESPLFRSFSEEELLALIDGLRLLIFGAGDIIVAEGDPGDSLFVVTTGLVKAFIRKPEGGAPRCVRKLREGDFFGEISILSGKARTATVTASTHCELLELDRATLEEITKTHPGVRAVLEDFYIQRASN